MALKGNNFDLPPLPKKLKKREADVTPKILAWFKRKQITAVFEIKATAGHSIPRSALLPHQQAALELAAKGTLVHKISDAGHVRTPFDGFSVTKVSAFVCVAFTAFGEAYIIPVKDWNGARVGVRPPNALRIDL